jgi:hypothetical protein
MFDYKHYVPILKARMGELGALAELDPIAKGAITPLLSIPALPWDFEKEEPTKKVDEYIPGFAGKIHKSWGDRRLFLDLAEVDGEILQGDRHPVTVVFDEANELGLSGVPVIGLQRSTRYLQSVREVVRKDKRGVCVRVDNSDLENPGALNNGLNELLTYLGLQRSECDLVFDLKYIMPETRGPLMFAMNTILSLLPGIEQWRTLTMAASSFPDSMMNIPAYTFHEVPRVEWDMWTSMVTKGGIPRLPAFGDYAISNPSPSGDGIDPRIMRMSANLRYTLDRTWLLLKGRNVRDHGYEQFNELCRLLVNADGHFKGPEFSWGDKYIDDAAKNAGGPGNATVWRKVGTSHHLAMVTTQIANLLG